MNKIEKLKLKHLCGFLPHEVYAIIDGVCTKVMPYHLGMHLKQIEKGQDFKLCLLPLSALTEPMEDGSVPIVELAKIAYPNNDWVLRDNLGTIAESDTGMYFMYLRDSNSFYIDGNISGCVPNQLQLFEYLYSKHFDIYGLIESGLAIDKRTVK